MSDNHYDQLLQAVAQLQDAVRNIGLYKVVEIKIAPENQFSGRLAANDLAKQVAELTPGLVYDAQRRELGEGFDFMGVRFRSAPK